MSIQAPSHNSLLLIIATWFCLAVSCCAVTFRLLTTAVIRQQSGWDDLYTVISLVFSIIQSALVLKQAYSTEQGVDATNVGDVERLAYATNLLYIFILAFAKISVLWFLRRTIISKQHRRVIFGVSCVVLVNTVWAFFGLALACGATAPWRFYTNSCPRLDNVWQAYTIIDVASDVAVVAIPIWMFWDLQMPKSRKMMVELPFTLRLLACATGIARIFYLPYANMQSYDQARLSTYNILTQVVPCVAIVTACVFCLKPFLEGFDSGLFLFGASVPVGGSRGASKGYGQDAVGRPGLVDYYSDRQALTGTTTVGRPASSDGSDKDLGVVVSQKELGSHGIQRTTQWTAEHVAIKKNGVWVRADEMIEMA